jgi:hypothetical protein
MRYIGRCCGESADEVAQNQAGRGPTAEVGRLAQDANDRQDRDDAHRRNGQHEIDHQAHQHRRIGEREGDRVSFLLRHGGNGLGRRSHGEKRVRRKTQKHRQHAPGDQRMDKPVSHRHGFDRQQWNNRCGDEEDRSDAYHLAAGKQQKREKDQQRDDQEQDKGAIGENLRYKNREGASGHHHDDKAYSLADAHGPSPGQELNGKHGR